METSVKFILKDNLSKYRDIFLKHFKVNVYPEGTIFNMAGLPATQLYFLVEGTVFVYTTNSDGYVRFIGSHTENTIFNLDSFRQENDDAVITTKAFTTVKAIPLVLNDIIALTKEEPSLYKDFLIYTADVLRLMCYDAKEQSINDVKTRLIHFFLLYTKDDPHKEIALSQYRIACAINASRVQVTRVCSDLKQRGLIEIKRNKIILKSSEELKNYCQE